MSAHEPPAAESEPKTPIWLTVLGACLLLALAVWYLAPHRELPDATIRVPAPTIAAPPAGPPTTARPSPAPGVLAPTRPTTPRPPAPPPGE